MDKSELSVRYFLRLSELMITYIWPMRNTSVNDLNRSQAAVLWELSAQDGMTLTQLAQQVSVSNQSMTNISSFLVEKGYVERIYNNSNRREIALHLTESGRKFVKEIQQEETNKIKDAVGNLTEEELQQLMDHSIQLFDLLEKTEFGAKFAYKKDRYIGFPEQYNM